jgi:uncharacterized RDD family membrane protein YckC
VAERSPTPAVPLPAAELDRRFYALVIDQALGFSVLALAAAVASRLDSWWVRLLLLVLAAGAVVTAYALGLATRGRTPGKALVGLRVLAEGTGGPVGLGPALVRTVVVGLAGLPTFGLGLATLAYTALADPTGLRRGWHDRLTRSVVVDARPVREPPLPAHEAPRPIVNLTAARLVPAADRRAATDRPPVALPPDRTKIRPPAAPARTAPARWRLTADSGESVLVEGLALIGRAPSPRAGEPVRHLLPLASGDMSLSKTHAAVDLIDGVLVATDRGSTNGSVLIRQGVSRDLVQGRPATLLDGDRVRFGDREFTVTREG